MNADDLDTILLAITLWIAAIAVAFVAITAVVLFVAWIFP